MALLLQDCTFHLSLNFIGLSVALPLQVLDDLGRARFAGFIFPVQDPDLAPRVKRYIFPRIMCMYIYFYDSHLKQMLPLLAFATVGIFFVS